LSGDNQERQKEVGDIKKTQKFLGKVGVDGN